MKRDIQVVRKFLNPKQGMAAVYGKVEMPLPYHVDEDTYGCSLDANLTLSDCGRQITLDFDAYDEADVKARLAKLDKIREALDLIEDGLIEYYFRAGVLTDAERKACRTARDEEGKEKAPRTISIADLEDYLDE
jgi:hypothetical protein